MSTEKNIVAEVEGTETTEVITKESIFAKAKNAINDHRKAITIGLVTVGGVILAVAIGKKIASVDVTDVADVVDAATDAVEATDVTV